MLVLERKTTWKLKKYKSFTLYLEALQCTLLKISLVKAIKFNDVLSVHKKENKTNLQTHQVEIIDDKCVSINFHLNLCS